MFKNLVNRRVAKGERAARVVDECRPIKASIRTPTPTPRRCYRIWQNTTVRDMRRNLKALGWEIVSGPTPCEHGPRGYRYVYDLEDWEY